MHLRFCRIEFYRYKGDLGSLITPVSDTASIRYVRKQAYEELVMTTDKIPGAVERQMNQIVENYKNVLGGDFMGWPIAYENSSDGSISFEETQIRDRIIGCLLGTAVGDALGLPREGLTRHRACRLFGSAPLSHRFVFGRGMISDDTEHATMVAQSLLSSSGDPDAFARSLAWRMRGWLLGVPAGIGFATLRAIIKLWFGWSPDKSGVYSAGNGPAMRAPIIGAYAYRDQASLIKLVRASTRLTHTDPRAEQGALIIALASSYGVAHGSVADVSGFISSIRPYIEDNQLPESINAVEEHVLCESSAEKFAEALGLTNGVSGFVNHTVTAALFCWLRYRTDACEAIEKVILLGGDTDTTGAIVGGLVGAT